MDALKNWRGRRVLVTGGSGFVGRSVLKLGLAAGVELHNLSTSLTTPSEGVIHHPADLADVDAVSRIVQEVQPDAVLHLAARGVVYNPNESIFALVAANISGLVALFETSLKLPVPPPFVIAGSWFEYAPSLTPYRETDPLLPTLPYTATKIAANDVAAFFARRLPVTVLRLFSLYGPHEKSPRLVPYIIEQAIKEQPVQLTPGEQVRDYVYVEDAAEAFWRALIIPPTDPLIRILNVGSGEAIQLKQFIALLVDSLQGHGLNADVRFDGQPYRNNENMYAVADTERLESCLKWKPATPWQTGLESTVTHFLQKVDE